MAGLGGRQAQVEVRACGGRVLLGCRDGGAGPDSEG